MAATIAKATGYDYARNKATQRIGSEGAGVEAATWRTSASAYVCKDGGGYIEVKRDGKVIHRFDFGPEGS